MKRIMDMECENCKQLVSLLLRDTNNPDVYQTECPNCNEILLFIPEGDMKFDVQVVRVSTK